jgi:hypothetical protein
MSTKTWYHSKKFLAFLSYLVPSFLLIVVAMVLHLPADVLRDLILYGWGGSGAAVLGLLGVQGVHDIKAAAAQVKAATEVEP